MAAGANGEANVRVQATRPPTRLAANGLQVGAGGRAGPPPALPLIRPSLPSCVATPTGAVVAAPADTATHEGGLAGAVTGQARAPGQVVAAVAIRRPSPLLEEAARAVDEPPVAAAGVTPVAAPVAATDARRLVVRREY